MWIVTHCVSKQCQSIQSNKSSSESPTSSANSFTAQLVRWSGQEKSGNFRRWCGAVGSWELEPVSIFGSLWFLEQETGSSLLNS